MNNLVEKVSRFLDYGARIAVAAIMFVTTANVVLRLFGSSLRGSVEMVQYLNAIAIGLALAFCAYHGGHVAVTFFTDKLSRKGQYFLNVLISLLVAVFLGLLTWQLYLYGLGSKEAGEVALTTGLPIYPVVFLVTAGVAVHLVVVILNLCKDFAGLFSASPDVVEKPEDNINVDDLISQ